MCNHNCEQGDKCDCGDYAVENAILAIIVAATIAFGAYLLGKIAQ